MNTFPPTLNYEHFQTNSKENFFTVNPYIHNLGSTMIILTLSCCLSLLILLKSKSDYAAFPPQEPPIGSCLFQRKSQTLVMTNKGPNDLQPSLPLYPTASCLLPSDVHPQLIPPQPGLYPCLRNTSLCTGRSLGLEFSSYRFLCDSFPHCFHGSLHISYSGKAFTARSI